VSHHQKKNSKLATLDAARELYFILVALAVLKSLEFSLLEVSSPHMPLKDWFRLHWRDPTLFAPIAMEFAFLFTLLRFSHGVSQLLASEKDSVESSGLPSSFRNLTLFMFLSVLGILFVLMGSNIADFPEFVFWLVIILGIDFIYVASSKVVRAPLRSLLRWIPGRILIIRRERERKPREAQASSDGTVVSGVRKEAVVPPPDSSATDDRCEPESRWINTTPGYVADAALEWMLSDLALIVFCVLLRTIWKSVNYQQYWFAAVLLVAGIADYVINLRFYFGGWNDWRKEKIVFVCSPFNGGPKSEPYNQEDHYRENIRRAQDYCREVMREGDIPFASHCFYPHFLDYRKTKDAILARYCSLAFLRACDAIYLYVPYESRPLVDLLLLRKIKWPRPVLEGPNFSAGMREKLAEARNLGLQIKYRRTNLVPSTGTIRWKSSPLVCPEGGLQQDKLESMKRVYVCTPLRGLGWDDQDDEWRRGELGRNTKLALWECFNLIKEGNGSIAPFAPQAFYPYFVPVLGSEIKWEHWFERSLEVLKICDAIYVYTKSGLASDDELSTGVTHLIALAEELGMEIQYRVLPQDVPSASEWDLWLPDFGKLENLPGGLPLKPAPSEKLPTVHTQADRSAKTAPSATEMTSKRTCVYFAGPLFTQGEWQWNVRLKDELEKLGLEVILPQNEAYPMLRKEQPFDARALFLANTSGIERADLVLAILDQADPDSGTCWECGYAYKLGCPVLGLRTDIRTTGDAPGASVNLMLPQSCREFLEVPLDKREDVTWVAARVGEGIERILKRTTS
jgi:nucleoside 2-deoxyribosyltransferase